MPKKSKLIVARRLTPQEVAAFERKLARRQKKVKKQGEAKSTLSSKQTSPIAQKFALCLESLTDALHLPPIKIDELNYANKQITIHLATGRQVKGHLSAPRILLSNCWPRKPKVRKQLFAVQGDGYAVGDWDLLRRTLTFGSGESDAPPVHSNWLALASEVLQTGDRQEAQLIWLQCSDFGLINKRTKAFKNFFPQVPKSAKRISTTSCAAYLEQMLPFASAPSPIDRFVAARAILDNANEALFEVTGQRHQRIVERLAALLKGLLKDNSPAVREQALLLQELWSLLT